MPKKSAAKHPPIQQISDNVMNCAKDVKTAPEVLAKLLWNNNCVAITIVFSYSKGMKDDLYS